MSDSNPVDILKKALLLEMRGRSFYTKVAQQTQEDPVREFFEMMADEEKQHVNELSRQYKAYQADGHFVGTEESDDKDTVSAKVLTDQLKKRITAASFEAAAVSAAMSMEQKAIALYAKEAKNATDPQAQKIYQWLADWEKNHLEMLAEIDREITENVWDDNNFWPF